MRPQVTALIDQADAASAHALGVMEQLAALEGTTAGAVPPEGAFRAMVDRMYGKAARGQLTLCPHLSYDRPEPAFWAAWAPGRIRCAACAAEAGHRIQGTAEDRRCDNCRKIGPSIYRAGVQLPSVVIDFAGTAKCMPPVIIVFGLCPSCRQATP